MSHRQTPLPLSLLASRHIPIQDVRQVTRLLQDNPTIPLSSRFHSRRSRPRISEKQLEQEVQNINLGKYLPIFDHIRRKARRGFDPFPTFFMYLYLLGPNESGMHLLTRFFSLENDNIPPKKQGLFYMGECKNINWFVVNWFDDPKKKVFVLYHRPDNVVRVHPLFVYDKYGNILKQPIRGIWLVRFEELKTFFNTARLIGVYMVDETIVPHWNNRDQLTSVSIPPL